MHVMEIVSGAAVNGAVVHCLWLSRALAQRGHEVTLVCRPGAWIATQALPETVSVVESDLHRWPIDELRRMHQLARERAVDVLHTHMSRAHFFGVLLRAMSGIPSVATAHSHHLQLHWMLNDRVIAVSAATARFHYRWNGVRRRQLHVIHNFIDVDRYASVPPDVGVRIRTELGIDCDHRLIGVIGDVIPRKGLADLLHALAAVGAAVPDARVLVIGRREDRYAQEMRRLAESLGVTARVVWTGHREDIPALLSAVDVVACPSRRDDLALVALEAMAAARPVVATTVGGFPECVVDGVTGVLVPPRDPARLAAALTTLLRDPDRRGRLGTAATARAREHFSIAQQVARIEEVLRSVAAGESERARARVEQDQSEFRSERGTIPIRVLEMDQAQPLPVPVPMPVPSLLPSGAARLEAGEIIVIPTPDLLPARDLEILRNHHCVSGAHKNIAYDPRTNRVTGVGARDPAADTLRRILRNYAERITAVLGALLPDYAATWSVDVTSFRPLDEAHRRLSGRARNDRLHIDAFPSRPTNGDRILRVFTNVHPDQSRVWLTADPLHLQLAALRQLPGFPHPRANASADSRIRAHLARLLHVPVLNRSPYDRFMLRLHDFMKRSDGFQALCRPERHAFAPDMTWIVFTDVVPHAVVTGQCAVEQTFIVPHASMQNRSVAPLTLFETLMPATVVSQDSERSSAINRSP